MPLERCLQSSIGRFPVLEVNFTHLFQYFCCASIILTVYNFIVHESYLNLIYYYVSHSQQES